MNDATPHPASLADERLLAECDVRFTRRSGPGGQNRNKVETAAILTHRPTGIVAEANEQRLQSRNRAEALFRLRLKLAIEFRSRAEGPAAPSATWHSRCHEGRLAINPRHEDFPTLLAEALDAIEANGGDIRRAAQALGCSASQLVKLLKDEPRAFAQLNRSRKERGLHALS